MTTINAASKRLLDCVFGSADEAWLVRGKYDANDKLVILEEGPAGSFSLPDDEDLYYCVSTVDGGRTKVKRVYALAIDDVGKEIDKADFEMMFPLVPTDWVRSSAGSFQVVVAIDGGMTPEEYTRLRRAMVSNPVWGKAHNKAAANIYRLPQGTHTKSTRGGWKVCDDRWTGKKYTPAELWAALGQDGSAAKGSGGGSKGDYVDSPELLKKLVAMIPNPAVDWDLFVNVGRAIWGASSGLGFDIFEAWAAKLKEADPALTLGRWNSYHDAIIGRKWLLRQAEAADPAGVGAWLQEEAKVGFDDNPPPPDQAVVTMHTIADFRSVVNEVDFIHVGTGTFWKPASVDANVAPVVVGFDEDGNPKTIKATTWLRSHGYVTELSWLPGLERIVRNRVIGVMGLEFRGMHSIFNLYQAPVVVGVETIWAEPWCDLVRRLWPDEANEIFDWFAHRVQRPGEKCNHALVLGGAQGIGKDTVLEAVRRAVGVGNCNEIMPSDLKGNFNDHVKSVLLVINELRDDDAVTQYVLYEKSKTLIAAPPYTLSINSKYIKKYVVPNVVGVVMTTNHKETGLYLPADDRRHLVCWSDVDAGAEGDGEFAKIWAWLNGGGFDHVAAWLRARDLSGFDCKAPPRKTRAFHEIVGAAFNPGEKALQDKIEAIGKPKVLRRGDLRGGAGEVFSEEGNALDNFLNDPKYRKVVAEALGRFGYRKVMNPAREDGRWKIGGQPDFVYGRKDVNNEELKKLAEKLGALDEEKRGKA